MTDVAGPPLVSVCIQTYQHAGYITQAIESVLSQQTQFPFELLIGEDDSADGTREICIDFARRDSRIRLFLNSRDNVIYTHGRATGRWNLINNLLHARGRYIALLPGDDYWCDPLKLQKQVDVLEARPEIIACHHWYRRQFEGVQQRAVLDREGYCDETITTLEDIFANRVRLKARTLMFRNVISPEFFPPWFSKVAFGDVPLSFLLGQYGNFYFIDEVMAVYRVTGHGLSGAGDPRSKALRSMTRRCLMWVEIWRYADAHYGRRFHRAASRTVRSFYAKLLRYYLRWMIARLRRMTGRLPSG